MLEDVELEVVVLEESVVLRSKVDPSSVATSDALVVLLLLSSDVVVGDADVVFVVMIRVVVTVETDGVAVGVTVGSGDGAL